MGMQKRASLKEAGANVQGEKGCEKGKIVRDARKWERWSGCDRLAEVWAELDEPGPSSRLRWRCVAAVSVDSMLLYKSIAPATTARPMTVALPAARDMKLVESSNDMAPLEEPEAPLYAVWEPLP